jgi:hypothetical protein
MSKVGDCLVSVSTHKIQIKGFWVAGLQIKGWISFYFRLFPLFSGSGKFAWPLFIRIIH